MSIQNNPIRENLATEAAVKPVILSEIKTHLRVDSDDQNDLLQTYLDSAIEWAESYTGRALITQTWEQFYDDFPSNSSKPIILLHPPLQSVSSITYTDRDGNSQTWAASKYQVETIGVLGRVLPKQGQDYPDTKDDTYNTVTVTYVAGYGDAASDVPQIFKQAIKQIVADWFRDAESYQISRGNLQKLPASGERLLSSRVVHSVM